MNKIKLILISSEPGSLQRLRNALAADEVPGSTGLQVLRELVKRNPFVNCALVSSLYPAEFHEATEGLGVFMQLPLNPGAGSAREITAHLEKIYQIDSP